MQNCQEAQVPQIQNGPHSEGSNQQAGLTSHTHSKAEYANYSTYLSCTHYSFKHRPFLPAVTGDLQDNRQMFFLQIPETGQHILLPQEKALWLKETSQWKARRPGLELACVSVFQWYNPVYYIKRLFLLGNIPNVSTLNTLHIRLLACVVRHYNQLRMLLCIAFYMLACTMSL